MLALKLTLVPLLLLIVSLSETWWGPSVAGWLSGLPLAAGPILYLLVITQGPIFGARAATISLSGVLALEAFNLAYAWTCRSHTWLISLMAGLLAWFAFACALSLLPASPIWASIVAIGAVSVSHSLLPPSTQLVSEASFSPLSLMGRMSSGALMTLLVTSLSERVGPAWSGLLAAFPLFGIILAVSSHRAHGPTYVISLFRGTVLGRLSFSTFFLLLAILLPFRRALPAFAEASIAAMLVQWLTRLRIPALESKIHPLESRSNLACDKLRIFAFLILLSKKRRIISGRSSTRVRSDSGDQID
jgi:xanthosine utilization system XapX-like protein